MTRYSSREPFNDDPLPWVWYSPSGIHSGRCSAPYRVLDGDAPGWSSREETRPEFDRPQHNPTNPILVEFRNDPHLSTRDRARDYLLYLNQYSLHILRRFESGPVDHARRVLTRLANLKEES